MANAGDNQAGIPSADPGDALRLAPDPDFASEALINIDALDFGPSMGLYESHQGFFRSSIDDLWSASLADLPDANASSNIDQPMYDGSPQRTSGSSPNSAPPGSSAQGNSELTHHTANSGSRTAAAEAAISSRHPSLPPKIGHRFTRDSARVLKQWFSAHSEHPYPSEEEKTMLQCQTGLSRTQVTNWLANARRRRTVDDSLPESSSRSGKSRSGSSYTPRRAPTPIPRSTTFYRNMDPLQRWVDSPPENEPAAASAIARAVASGDALPSLSRRNTGSSDGKSSRRRRHASSASSFATSSVDSTDSRSSRGSISASSSLSRGRSLRRRRNKKTSLAIPRHAFQCTFCTETFRTKYDWQRHENSLHLPLERWVCSPNGPSAVNPENGQTYCVFCGETEPSETHLASHNPAACQERSFSRKDHLKQHLRLVHNAGLIDLSMKLWKAAKPEIRSRCGFCKAELETWPDRVDHLANHFKLGCSMGDWSGDWGFEDSILETLENAMPPYLIDFERGTPFPFEASGKPPDSPRSAYELITLELAYFIQQHYDTSGDMPNNKKLQLEACRIIFASEVTFPEQNPDSSGGFSWLRDLILSSYEITQEARFGPIRSRAESRLSMQKIKGKNALFEACPLESHLHAFVHVRQLSGVLAVQDHELQKAACKIITQMEGNLGTTPDFVANWLVTLINQSTDWLLDFRRRAGLVSGQESWDITTQSIQSSLFENQSNRQFPGMLFDEPFSQQWFAPEPSGNSFDTGQGWNVASAGREDSSSVLIQPWLTNTTANSSTALGSLPSLQGGSSNALGTGLTEGEMSRRPAWLKTGIFILNDSNHHRWLASELKKWVTATMSPNNPNCHVPSDEELRHQSRCLLYNDDDPWNQTAADNAMWLEKFKQDVGIL